MFSSKSVSHSAEMSDQDRDLFTCDGCSEDIPADRARVMCHVCKSYYLCANCFVIKQFSKPHVESHSTMILNSSGFKSSPPVLPPRSAPALPRRSSIINKRQSVRGPENWGVLWNMMKAPLEKKEKRERKGTIDTKRDEVKDVGFGRSLVMTKHESNQKDNEKGNISPLFQNPATNFPPSPTKSVRRGTSRFENNPYPTPERWEPLFEVNGTPATICVLLMGTIFDHLDPDNTGHLSPEAYSSFLDTQGCALDSNSWKKTLGNDITDSSKDMADFELGLYFQDNNISHTLRVRSKTPTSPKKEVTSAVGRRIRQSISFKPNMPLLSKQGFVDLMKIEYCKDFDLAYQYLRRAIQAYGIWTELGEMPRSVFPELLSTVGKPQGETLEEKFDQGSDEIEESYMTPPSSPTRLRGEQSKVEAWIRDDEFTHDESLGVDEPESAIHTIDEGKENACGQENSIMRDENVMIQKEGNGIGSEKGKVKDKHDGNEPRNEEG